MNLKILSLVAFALAVAGLVYLVTKEYIFSKNIFSIIIQALAAALMVWSRLTLGARSFHAAANATRGPLITTGPYRWFRHPIYTAVIYFSAAALISFPLINVIIAVLLIFAGLFTRMLLEEKSLRETYKEEYEQYAKKTKRMIPFVF